MEYNTHLLPDAYCPCCKWALGQDCPRCSEQSCPPRGSTGPASSFPSPDLSSFKWSLLVSSTWSQSGKSELTARGTWCDSTESLAASGSSASLTWSFYRTRVRLRSLFTLVTNWLTYWLTHSLLFSKFNRCDPGVWRCQLKTCWCCNCCWWWSSWYQFVAGLEAEVWSKSSMFVQTFYKKFGQDFEVEVQARFEAADVL